MALTGTLLADFSAFIGEAKAATSAVQGMEKGADQAASKLSGIGANFDIKKAVSDPVGTATEAMKELAGSMGPVGVAGAATAATVVTLGVALISTAESAAKVVAEFDDLADKTGISVPTLSRLSNAAKVIGADMGQLTDIVFKLEKGMGENSTAFQKGLETMGLSTAELRAAGPDRYLELVTAGLKSIPDAADRAAAGNAVLGKGYKDVAAQLNDLDAGLRLTADIEPFTAQQAADAEAFQFQIASIKQHISATATAFGNELIPAAGLLVDVLARVGLAFVHVADAGGLISGTWKGLKLGLGEAALAEETYNAVAATTNRLFQEQGATAASVAEKMLTLGYSEKTVAEQTGLTIEAVRSLNTALSATKTEAADNAAAWERVNGKLAEGKPSLEGVSLATRGLALDMKEAGVEMKDITATTGLTAAQMAELEKQTTAAKTAFQEWQKAVAEINGAMIGWQTTLDTIDGSVVEGIKFALSAGASQKDLATSYGLTAQQIKAVTISLEEDAAALNNNADVAASAARRRIEITQLQTKAINDQIIATFEKRKADDAANAAFLEGALKDAQAQDAIQQGVKTTADTTQAAARTIGSSFEENFARSAAAFDSFKGVVVGGAGTIVQQLTSVRDAGSFLENQRQIFDAQMARGQFFVNLPTATAPLQTRDTGGPVVAGTPYLIGGGKEPEIFVPAASGFVTPGGGKGGGVTVTNVFNIVDTEANITRRVSDNITRSIMQAQKL